ncbi:MAG: Gfo/Idh/MocA family protein [Beutenbergiaceae bacterium]
MTPLRAGLVGTGEWASAVHGEALSSTSGIEFAGLWGRNMDAAAGLSKRLSVPAYATFDALLDEVDAIVLALPPGPQAELAAHAAARGVHLLLEKPVAENVAAGRDLAAVIETSGVAAVVFVTRMFDPQQRLWLDQERARAVTACHAEFRSDAFVSGSRWMGGWREYADEFVDIGPHLISQVEWVLGPITGITSAERDDDEAWNIVFAHGSDRRSSIYLNLHDAGNDCERYTFDAPEGRTSRAVSIDSVAAARVALSELRITSMNGVRDRTSPWSVEAGVHALELMAALGVVKS